MVRVKAKIIIHYEHNKYRPGDVFELDDSRLEANKKYVEIVGKKEKVEKPVKEEKPVGVVNPSLNILSNDTVVDIQPMTVAEIKDYVASADIETIRALYEQEKNGKARKTVLAMLEV